MEKQQETVDQIDNLLESQIEKFQSIIDEFKRKVAEGTRNWDIIGAVQRGSGALFEAHYMVEELKSLREDFSNLKSGDIETVLKGMSAIVVDALNDDVRRLIEGSGCESTLEASFKRTWLRNGDPADPISSFQEMRENKARGKLIKKYKEIIELLEGAGLQIDAPSILDLM